MSKRIYDTLLFDLDGTLIDTIRDLGEAVNHSLALRGLPLHSPEEFPGMVGHGVRNLVKNALPEQFKEDDAYVDSALADFKEYYCANIDVHTRPYPGMPALLTELQEAGCSLAVVSNKFQSGTERLVAEFFPDIRFAAVLGNREGFPLKPDPAIVSEVLSLTGAKKAAFVGDSATDMLTARNGGIPAIAVGWGYRSLASIPDADFRAGSPADLRRLLLDERLPKILFIANPVSGRKDKRKTMSLIEDNLDRSRYEYEIVYTEGPGHATVLARESEADVVVAVGGDGTVSEVAQGVMGTDKVLGIIPCGSGDGFALHLGISRNPIKAVRTLNEGVVARVDSGTVDGCPFFCTTGVGLDADVAQAFALSKQRGLGTYISTAWKLWKRFSPDTYVIEVDGKRVETPAVFVTAGNADQWGNYARITSLASVQDSLLDLTVVLPFKTWEIPFLVAKLMGGRAHTSRRTCTFKGKRIVIQRSGPGPAHRDGEPCRMGKVIEVKVVPESLNVIVPKGRKI